MTTLTDASIDSLGHEYELSGSYSPASRAGNSAVSWGAIVAGAVACAALSLILLILGVGLGLSSVSPWTHEGITAASFGVSSIIWLSLTQLLSSAMGGYIAGRLRVKWTGTNLDEVYFRDTAHGFLTWAVASLMTAALLTATIGSILSGGIRAGSSLVGGMANSAAVATTGVAATGQMVPSDQGSIAYFIDSLFRRDMGVEAGNSAEAPIPEDASERVATSEASEVGRIFLNTSRSNPLPPEDLRYVGQLVARRTGLSPQEAEKRVADVYARAQARLNNAETAAKDAADKARRASAYVAVWTFVSLLIGAFIASLSATYGGRRRDA